MTAPSTACVTRSGRTRRAAIALFAGAALAAACGGTTTTASGHAGATSAAGGAGAAGTAGTAGANAGDGPSTTSDAGATREARCSGGVPGAYQFYTCSSDSDCCSTQKCRYGYCDDPSCLGPHEQGCSTNTDCCRGGGGNCLVGYGYCAAGWDVVLPPGVCRIAGDGCTSDGECCNGICVDQFCQPGACKQLGEACASGDGDDVGDCCLFGIPPLHCVPTDQTPSPFAPSDGRAVSRCVRRIHTY